LEHNEKEKEYRCPVCGNPVSKDDFYCSRCGAKLSDIQALTQETEEAQTYERKYGLFQRLWGVIFNPKETLNDIAQCPEYGGPLLVIILNTVLGIVILFQAASKISFVGPYASKVTSMFYSIVSLTSVLAFFIYIARWLIKSLIVWKACDFGSGWNFSNAASVTGYVYLADFFSLIISVFFTNMLPSLTIDTSSAEAAARQASEYISNLMGYQPYLLMLSLVFIIWKSYLGGLGTHYGTKKLCSKTTAIIVFIMLSLIGLAINYLLRFS